MPRSPPQYARICTHAAHRLAFGAGSFLVPWAAAGNRLLLGACVATYSICSGIMQLIFMFVDEACQPIHPSTVATRRRAPFVTETTLPRPPPPAHTTSNARRAPAR